MANFQEIPFSLIFFVLLLSVSLRTIEIIIFSNLYLYISESKNRKDHIFLKFAHVTQMKHRQMRVRFCIMLMFLIYFVTTGMEKRCNNLWIVNKFAQVSKRLQIVIAWKFNDGWKMFFPKKMRMQSLKSE